MQTLEIPVQREPKPLTVRMSVIQAPHSQALPQPPALQQSPALRPASPPVLPSASRPASSRGGRAPARRGPNPIVLLLTLGYLAVIGFITLSPGDSGSDVQGLSYRVISFLRSLPTGLSWDQLEFSLNIAMFVPLGVLLVLLFGPRFFWMAAVASLAITFSIEGLQHLIPFRVPDTRDLFANGLGGLLGMLGGLMLLGMARLLRPGRR